MRNALIELRKNKKWSQEKAAIECEISQSFYSAIEIGVRRPSPKVAKRIEKVFGISWMLFYEDEAEQKNNCPKKGS